MWKRCTCFVLLITMLGGVAQGAFDPLQESTLIGWWKCDEGQGSVVADSSPNKRDGTFVNGAAAWTSGVSGSAVRLVGPTLVELPALNLRLTQATMAGWFLPNGPQPDWASMIMHRGTGLAHGFNFLADRRLAYHWADAQNTWSYRGNAYYAADEWTHCAVTVEPDKATFYVNGVSASVNTVAHPEANWDNPFHLGGDGGSGWVGRRMNGSLDDVMFFSRALTAAEVKSLVPPKVKAMKPSPADKAVGVTMPLLQWTKGDTALFHNVYLGTSPDLTEADLVGARQPFAMYYHAPGLQAGVTYYWRVDEIEADMVTIHKGDVWSFTTEPLAAYAPKPADGAGNLMPAPALSWLPGKAAVKHRVYFSSTLAEVENGAAAANQGDLTETTFKPGVLRASTTYYWRVDEIKADGSVEKGPIWSFTTQDGVAKKIVRQWWNGIAGTALSALTGSPNYPDNPTGSELVDAFEGPTNVADNYGSRLYGWLTPPQSGDYTFWMASDDFGELRLSTDADPAKAVVIASVPGWTNPQEWGKYPAQKSAAIKLEAGKKYYIEVLMKEGGGGDNVAVSWQGPGIPAQAIISAQYVDTFALPPLQAFSPSPANGAVDAPQAGALSWSAGEKAQKHDVYFGDDKAAVAAADAKSPLFQGQQTGTSFNAGELEWGKTYYWRVDEVNPAEADSPWKGAVWSFTTATFIPVDDMESYTDDEGNRIYEFWIDGWINKTGSVVGNLVAPFAERTIVRSGKQAMPMDYNNIKSPFYSEAELPFSPLQNWTTNGVTDLSLWFRGRPVSFVDKGDGAFTVSGSGHDIWDNADDFRFVYKRLSGNGSITVKVESLVNTNGWAKAGVMIREILTDGSTHAAAVITPANGMSFPYRTMANGPSLQSNQTGLAAPYWVRITRTGNLFKAERSPDGKIWTAQDTDQNILMGTSVYIGLCVTSHNTAATTTVEFSNVATTGNVTGAWQQVWLGDDPDLTNGAAGLYVAVEDSTGKSAVATHPDPAAAALGVWTEWKIPLSSFPGVNLARVKKLSLGVGAKQAPVPDGAGRIYIDDIRVTKP